MPNNRRSQIITQGITRSPNRSMLRAVGFDNGDFDKPIVGIANGHSTMNPCNAGLQPLADRVEAAVRAAGGMPQTFGVITVTDGISMGTEGMKYSLVSREVIADAIETATMSQSMDGVVVIGGCDKNMPGAMIGMLRMNIPGIFVYGGTIKPGHYKGKDLTIVSPFEAVGEFTAGRLSKEDFDGIERNALPGTGACGGMFTANTMSSAFEALGMSLPYSSTMANVEEEKVTNTRESARVLVKAVKADLKPRDIMTCVKTDPLDASYTKIFADGIANWIKLKPGMEKAAAFLETHRAAAHAAKRWRCDGICRSRSCVASATITTLPISTRTNTCICSITS